MEIGPLITQRPLTVGPDHTLAEAARRMNERNVGSAVVLLDDGSPAILTERDILRSVARGVDPEKTTVEDYMTATAITGSPSWDVIHAAERMIDGGFRHLIVMANDGTVEGVLSIRDVVTALLKDRRSGAASAGPQSK